MFRKAFISLAAAAVAGILASSASAAVNVQLTIVASAPGPVLSTDPQDDPGTQFIGGTWQVYAQLTGDTSTTLGLSGLQVDVIGGGGISVEDDALGDQLEGTTLDLPRATNGTLTETGFNVKDATGSNGLAIAGYQDTTAYVKKGTFTSLLTGVGLSAGSQGADSWALPVLVADGYYSGTSGTLTVDGATNFMNLLPNPLPTPTTGGVGVETFSPDTVNGVSGTALGTASVTIGAVPEPASIGMLALGGLALLARRRKSV